MKRFALRARNPRRSTLWLGLLAAAPLLVSGCSGLGEAMTAHTDVVARAAGNELKVEEEAQLLSLNPQIPADPKVVRALADYWVDYTLLASAVAEDSSLSAVDLTAFVKPAEEQAVIIEFMNRTIHPDTTFTDQELQQAWAEEGPGVEIHARHILLRIPADATPAQRDSVKQLAESIRQQAVSGADFATLAKKYSQDPGSAKNGGDLGFFGHGRMVQPFDEAAFKLKPGEISPVVETPFGYHVIKVEERRQQPMGDQHDRFEQYMKQKRIQEVETAYLDSLTKAANIQVQPGGIAVVKEIAKRPEQQLRGRAAKREIATYNHGAFTTGDFLAFVRTQPPQVQDMFSTASDEDLTTAIEQMTRKEIILQAAKAKGVSLSRAEQDSIRSQARDEIQRVVKESGLSRIAGTRANGAAIDTIVKGMLKGLVTQQLNLPPLGRFGYALRDVYPAEINEGTFQQVVDRLQKIRESEPQPQGTPAPQGAAPQQPPAQPDTAA